MPSWSSNGLAAADVMPSLESSSSGFKMVRSWKRTGTVNSRTVSSEKAKVTALAVSGSRSQKRSKNTFKSSFRPRAGGLKYICYVRLRRRVRTPITSAALTTAGGLVFAGGWDRQKVQG